MSRASGGAWRPKDPKQIKFGYSHPTTPVRSLNLSKAREEIQTKRASGTVLAPTLKPTQQ